MRKGSQNIAKFDNLIITIVFLLIKKYKNSSQCVIKEISVFLLFKNKESTSIQYTHKQNH